MEKKFECTFEITLETYLEMADKPIAPKAKKMLRLFYIRNIFALCLGVALVLVSLIGGLSTWMVVFCFLITMLPVYFLASRRSRNAKYYSQYLKTNNMEKWVRVISFTDEQVSAKDGSTELALAYDRFDAFSEDEERFYLHGGDDLCLRMPKDGFTIGTKEDFAEFFKGKMGERG